MPIIQKPFTRYNEEKKADTFTIRLNKQEREQLENDKKKLQQAKDSTAFKQLADIGRIVLHEGKTARIISIVTHNKRRNRRVGIADFEQM